MPAERHVKLFRNGRNQAVRIPREFELPGQDARDAQGRAAPHYRAGPRVLPFVALLATLRPIKEDFPMILELPSEPVRRSDVR